MPDPVAATLEVTGNVARLTFSRPETGNLIDFGLANAIADLTVQVAQRDDVWVLVVDAAGQDFCTGTAPAALSTVRDDSFRLSELRVAQRVAQVEKPVVCAIQGAAHEQGLEIALSCDVRIADATSTFGMRQVMSSGMPWDGGTQRLPRIVGRSRAMEMLLTGRMLNADEALTIGLLSEVVAPGSARSRAVEVAHAIAGHGPIALRYLKEAVSMGADTSLAHGLRLEADLSFLLQSTGDRGEGISSFLERRTPDYRGV